MLPMQGAKLSFCLGGGEQITAECYKKLASGYHIDYRCLGTQPIGVLDLLPREQTAKNV